MRTRTRFALACVAFVLTSKAALVWAASHREAPLTALDQKADITDFFAFVSYDDPTKVTVILAVDPLLHPANGPNYFPFDPNLRYEIHVDNDFDAEADVTFALSFETQIRLPEVFTGFAGAGDGVVAPDDSPPPIAPETLVVPPAITALDGPGSAGLALRQTYAIRLERDGDRVDLGEGRTLFAVPSNVGPRTMPDYAALAAQGIHDLGDGIRVFAGTVEDPFWIDLGAAFDTLNFRPEAFETGIPGVLGDAQDRNDGHNFAPDNLKGLNVNAIAIEVPIVLLTRDGKLHGAADRRATLGFWGSTSRATGGVGGTPGGRTPIGARRLPVRGGDFVQVQRMGNPLFNELIIGTGAKDAYNRQQPKDDDAFADFALDPLLARVIHALYEGAVPIPDPPRLDLLLLLQYRPPIAAPGTPPGPIADLLRLNTGIPPTPPDRRSRLGLLTLLDDVPDNDDPAGWPNGRRVSDDVTDIATRVIVGVLAGPPFDQFPNDRLGDGVNTNDVPYQETFPYVAWAHSGRGYGDMISCAAPIATPTPAESPSGPTPTPKPTPGAGTVTPGPETPVPSEGGSTPSPEPSCTPPPGKDTCGEAFVAPPANLLR